MRASVTRRSIIWLPAVPAPSCRSGENPYASIISHVASHRMVAHTNPVSCGPSNSRMRACV